MRRYPILIRLADDGYVDDDRPVLAFCSEACRARFAARSAELSGRNCAWGTADDDEPIRCEECDPPPRAAERRGLLAAMRGLLGRRRARARAGAGGGPG